MKLEQQLNEIETTVQLMYDKVLDSYIKLDSLLDGYDVELALEIIEADQYINQLEIEINNQAVYALALLQPVAKDLRLVITSIKVASELERIADYAKNVANILIKSHVEYEGNELLKEYFKKILGKVKEMLVQVQTAFASRNTELAFVIGKEDRTIDRWVSELLTKLNQENIEFKQSIFIMKMIRNMERSGDHIMNICEQIIYLGKGQYYEFG